MYQFVHMMDLYFSVRVGINRDINVSIKRSMMLFTGRRSCLFETDDSKYRNIKTICSRLESLDLLNNRCSVLDVGSGMGWSLEWLKNNYDQFHEFYAIESSEHCVENINGIADANVIANDVEFEWKSTGIDFVIMRHVLEHFMNPVEVLKKNAENLSADGIV